MKTQWVAGQPRVVRHAARLLKQWARAVCLQESTNPLCLADSQEQEDHEPSINTHALTVAIAAMNENCPSDSAMDLCFRAFCLLSLLRLDLLVVVSFEEDGSLKMSRGARYHRELAMSLEFTGNLVTALAIEDIVQADRLYGCSSSIRFDTLAIYAAAAISRSTSACKWSEVLAPYTWQSSDPALRDVLQRFVPCMARHISDFTSLQTRFKCPGGHELNCRTTIAVCDECSLDDLCMLSCRRCNFDLCERCAYALRYTCCHISIPFQNWPGLTAGRWSQKSAPEQHESSLKVCGSAW